MKSNSISSEVLVNGELELFKLSCPMYSFSAKTGVWTVGGPDEFPGYIFEVAGYTQSPKELR